MDANVVDERALTDLIGKASAPLTARRVAEATLGSSGDRAVAEAEEALSSLQRAGRLHRYPPERKGWSARFGSVPPVEWVKRRILRKVKDAGGKVTAKQVQEHLRKWERSFCDEAVGGLIRDGDLHHLTVRFKYLVTAAPTPCDYLLPRQETALKEILLRINLRRAEPLSLEDLRSFLDGSSARSAADSNMAGELTEELLRAWYDADVPRLGGTTSVPIPWTWKRDCSHIRNCSGLYTGSSIVSGGFPDFP